MEQLNLNPNNPRIIKKESFEKLKKSIKEFPQMLDIRPIIYDETSTILGGNMRYRALQELEKEGLEIKDSWFKNVNDLTEEQKKEFVIKDNVPFGDWDYDVLANEWSDLPLDDWGVDTTQWDNNEVVEDEPPEVSDEEPISKYGEVYQLGRHRLVCGDSTKIEDVEKLMDGQKADMVFTDPPYNVDYEGKTKERLKIQNDRNSLVEFREMISSVIDNMVVFTKRGGCYYVCIPLEVGVTDLFLEKTHLQSVIIWLKNIIVMGRKDYQQKTEPILFMTNIEDKGYTEENTYRGIVYGWKAGDSHDFYGGRKQSNVWEFDKPSKNKEHPTMKPIALCARGIANSSKTDNIILDLFGGSGSTLIACEQLNRNCYMMELDPKYCDVIRKRYAKFVGKEDEWQTI